MKLRVLGCVVLAALLVAGCAGQRVEVVDQFGRPVEGAEVVAVAPSINGGGSKTDASGDATVPASVGLQRTQWVDVSKNGFQRVQVAVPAHGRLRVALQPASP